MARSGHQRLLHEHALQVHRAWHKHPLLRGELLCSEDLNNLMNQQGLWRFLLHTWEVCLLLTQELLWFAWFEGVEINDLMTTLGYHIAILPRVTCAGGVAC